MPTHAALTLRYLEQKYPIRDEVVAEVVRAGRTTALRALLASTGNPGADIREHARAIYERQLALGRATIQHFPDLRLSPHSEPVAFALIGTESPNAVAIHDRSDESFGIGLDPGPVNLFNGVFLSAIYAMRSGDLPIVAWTLHDFVHALYLNRIVPGFEACQLRLINALPNFLRLFGGVGDVVMRFIIGHELGHISLGHFTQKHVPRMRLVAGVDREEEISAFDHECEFAADAWAVEFMRKSLPPTATIVEAIGIRLLPAAFFAIVALAQELYEPHTPIGQRMNESHPSPWDRGQRLQAASSLPFPIANDPVLGLLQRMPDFLHTHRAAILDLARHHPADRPGDEFGRWNPGSGQ